MTRFALGLKCGCFGASGLTTPGAVDLPRALSAPSRDASAIEPKPTPHCRKNQRRLMNWAASLRSSCWKFIVQRANASYIRPIFLAIAASYFAYSLLLTLNLLRI